MNKIQTIKESNIRGWKRGPVYYEMKTYNRSFQEASSIVFDSNYNSLDYVGNAYLTIKNFIKSLGGSDTTFVYAKNMIHGHNLAELYLLIESGDLAQKIKTEQQLIMIIKKLVEIRKEEYDNYKKEVTNNE